MLRRYYGELLSKELVAIWAFCDTKYAGTDYNCLGVLYQYGDDYYLYDVVFQSIDPYLLDDINEDYLIWNNIQIAALKKDLLLRIRKQRLLYTAHGEYSMRY